MSKIESRSAAPVKSAESTGWGKFAVIAAMVGVAVLGVGAKVGSDVVNRNCDLAASGPDIFQSPGMPLALCDKNDAMRTRVADLFSPVAQIEQPVYDVNRRTVG